jgi:hypothetical protein
VWTTCVKADGAIADDELKSLAFLVHNRCKHLLKELRPIYLILSCSVDYVKYNEGPQFHQLRCTSNFINF